MAVLLLCWKKNKLEKLFRSVPNFKENKKKEVFLYLLPFKKEWEEKGSGMI